MQMIMIMFTKVKADRQRAENCSRSAIETWNHIALFSMLLYEIFPKKKVTLLLSGYEK